jgi:hypothetical protein
MVKRARLFVATLALSACGLLPTADPEPPFPGDGVAAFGASDPIELCLGTAHVVSPDASSGAGAVCVPAGSQGKACTSDDTCDGLERCICGRCIVEACAGGATCGEGRVCRDKRCTTSCAKDADCKPDERCNAGGCARACGGDAQCHHGERCDALSEVCVAKLCSDATPCGAGDTCEAEAVTGELHEPVVTEIGGVPVAYVELRTMGASASSSIYRTRIDAPGRWTAEPSDPVIAAEMGMRAGAPSVLVDGDRVEMLFAVGDGAAIAHAVSTDGGRTFVRDAAPVLEPAAAWEKGWIGSPAAVRYGGATLLFYEGGPRAGIGMARLDGATATRVGDGPIVTPALVQDPLFWREVSEIGAPHAVVANDILRVYFTGRGVEGSDALLGDAAVPADPNDSIGLVASRDGKAFTPYPAGPVLARITNLRAYLGEREAAVRMLAGGGAEITFVSTDASGKSVSGLARAGD